MDELTKILNEMRERKVNNGATTSPTLVAWADRIEAALSPAPVCFIPAADAQALVAGTKVLADVGTWGARVQPDAVPVYLGAPPSLVPTQLDEALNAAVHNLEMIGEGRDLIVGSTLTVQDMRRLANDTLRTLLDAWNAAPQPAVPEDGGHG